MMDGGMEDECQGMDGRSGTSNYEDGYEDYGVKETEKKQNSLRGRQDLMFVVICAKRSTRDRHSVQQRRSHDHPLLSPHTSSVNDLIAPPPGPHLIRLPLALFPRTPPIPAVTTSSPTPTSAPAHTKHPLEPRLGLRSWRLCAVW